MEIVAVQINEIFLEHWNLKCLAGKRERRFLLGERHVGAVGEGLALRGLGWFKDLKRPGRPNKKLIAGDLSKLIKFAYFLCVVCYFFLSAVSCFRRDRRSAVLGSASGADLLSQFSSASGAEFTVA